jgi:hypothetical protein
LGGKYVATPEDAQFKPDKTHIEMWRHYDSLRQAKNSGFLTANSILVAITGLLFKEDQAIELIKFVSIVGIFVCTSWFLLLTRNNAYIEYHRERAGGGNKEFWMPETWTPRSKWLDRTPLAVFFLFWVGIPVFMLICR